MDSSAKLSGELNIGYQWMSYDNPLDVNGFKYDDKDTWIASTSINFQATPKTILALSLTRAVRLSGSNINEYYEDTGIGLSLQQKILAKLTLAVGGSYSNNDYDDSSVANQRDDDNYKANIDLTYDIQDWLSAGVAYDYWKRESNYRVEDFEDNRFTVSISLVY